MQGQSIHERALYADAFSNGYREGQYDGEWNPAGAHDTEAALRQDARIFREAGSGRATRITALGEARGYRAALAVARTKPKRTTFSREEGGYELDDPKHPRYHEVFADIADL